MKSKNINQLVVAGVLCGIGIVVPMLMPKIVIGPMSFTLASHVAIFMAMFISPKLAAAVCAGCFCRAGRAFGRGSAGQL